MINKLTKVPIVIPEISGSTWGVAAGYRCHFPTAWGRGRRWLSSWSLISVFVKKVVRKHGGKITEKSELGVGSKFIIKIHYRTVKRIWRNL